MKLKTYLILCLLPFLLLSSCDKSEEEDIRNIDLNRENKTITIVVNVHNNINNLDLENVLGFARFNVYVKEEPENPKYTCQIFVVRPKNTTDTRQMETWGHELMHCVYGVWHKEIGMDR